MQIFLLPETPSFSYISREFMPEGGSEIPLRILYLGESSATKKDAECQTN